VWGVSDRFIEAYESSTNATTRFDFAASAAQSPEVRANPWRLLAGANAATESVPVVLDKNTAMFSLKLYGGIGEEFTMEYPGGQTIRFRVVGLLANSVFQGGLLISEADFVRLFPSVSGYRFFLMQSVQQADPADVAIALEKRLSDQGLEVRLSREILKDLLDVQNTYISAFQTLGALGLILGTVGLAVAQFRGILERRRELGRMRAIGYSQSRMAYLVLLENIVLLLSGLGLGVIAALVAVLPHMLAGGAQAPFANLAGLLSLVMFVGILVGWFTVRRVLRLPLLATLRGE
jgi:putative ABC transport system permease protein